MNTLLRTSLAAAALIVTTQAGAQITFYEHDNFQGRSYTTQRQVGDFGSIGFNDRASSIKVLGDRWEVCQDARFAGSCVVLRRGEYASLSAMNLNDRVSSARLVNSSARIDDARYAPLPVVENDYQRRGNERLYQAEVTSVRAVVGTPDRRCWVEREQVSQERGRANVPAAIAGAVIGGILGHQIGGGTGRDIATVGGVVGGAAVGANVGRDGGARQTVAQDVQRCETTPSATHPDYWDVTYSFRGREHRVQMTSAPGRTVTVNRQGEPRA
jgi:uncharacterized protein YcfJ